MSYTHYRSRENANQTPIGPTACGYQTPFGTASVLWGSVNCENCRAQRAKLDAEFAAQAAEARLVTIERNTADLDARLTKVESWGVDPAKLAEAKADARNFYWGVDLAAIEVRANLDRFAHMYGTGVSPPSATENLITAQWGAARTLEWVPKSRHDAVRGQRDKYAAERDRLTAVLAATTGEANRKERELWSVSDENGRLKESARKSLDQLTDERTKLASQYVVSNNLNNMLESEKAHTKNLENAVSVRDTSLALIKSERDEMRTEVYALRHHLATEKAAVAARDSKLDELNQTLRDTQSKLNAARASLASERIAREMTVSNRNSDISALRSKLATEKAAVSDRDTMIKGARQLLNDLLPLLEAQDWKYRAQKIRDTLDTFQELGK